MLSKKMTKALNQQINAEIYSAYLYLSMSAHCADKNLNGFAHWMQLQHDEEMAHAMKIYRHILDNDAQVELLAIDKPPKTFPGPTGLFKQVLEHEKMITGLIHKLYAMAVAENDYPSQVMLQWFISEQQEEEATASDILGQLEMLKDDPRGVFMMDRELGQRAPSPETAAE